jgi:hypothetical protein
MNKDEKTTPSESSLRKIVTILLAVAILVPSLFGFGTKFYEFVLLARGNVEGVFAVTPVINYLMASLGFLCLLGWAAANGMFRDIEQPKLTMLENEELLDAQSNAALPFDQRTNRS